MLSSSGTSVLLYITQLPVPAVPFVLCRFYMTSTVTYVALPQTEVTGTRKPAPPLATPLSPNIFYPFVTSAATGLVTPSAVGLLGASLVAVVALLLQVCIL